MITTLVSNGPLYYSQGDEDAFFAWLQHIGCVNRVRGEGATLHILLKTRTVSDAELRELIALFHRYQLEKRPLAQFLTTENRAWFRDDEGSYWYRDVFGSG